MKKSFKNMVLILGGCLLFTSCLKHGLSPLPAFTDADIQRFDFEYRWDNNGKFEVVTFNTNTPVINGDTIYVTTTVPGPSGDFTTDIKQGVNVTNIVGYCNIATAATIKPIDGASELGVPGDFSKPASYQVTAADGNTQKKWILVLTLVN